MSIIGELSEKLKDFFNNLFGGSGSNSNSKKSVKKLDPARIAMRKAAVEAMKNSASGGKKSGNNGTDSVKKVTNKSNSINSGLNSGSSSGSMSKYEKKQKKKIEQTAWPEHMSANAFSPDDFLSADLPDFLTDQKEFNLSRSDKKFDFSAGLNKSIASSEES